MLGTKPRTQTLCNVPLTLLPLQNDFSQKNFTLRRILLPPPPKTNLQRYARTFRPTNRLLLRTMNADLSYSAQNSSFLIVILPLILI